MEAIFALIVLYAAMHAIVDGTKEAGRAVKKAYHGTAARWPKSKPSAPTPAAAKVFAGLATAIGAPFHVARGAVAGAKTGWPEGWQRGRAWHERRVEAKAARNEARQLGDYPTDELPYVPAAEPGHDRDGSEPIETHGPDRVPVPPADAVPVSNEPVPLWPSRPVSVKTTDAETVPSRDGAGELAELSPRRLQLVPNTETAAAERSWGPAVVDTPDGPVTVNALRNPDGSLPPETERFFQHRLAGYDGWIDQDGNKVTGPEFVDSAHHDVPAGGGTTTTQHPEGSQMAIVTNTGGEVLNMQQLVTELEGISKEATADLEDAEADRQRAVEDLSRIEVMVASLKTLDLDSQTLSEVGALTETASSRRSAAEQRAQAAEARQSQAQTALKGVQDRHSLMAEAHANTPHAAEKAFYAG